MKKVTMLNENILIRVKIKQSVIQVPGKDIKSMVNDPTIEIVEIGDKVTKVSVGDKVVVERNVFERIMMNTFIGEKNPNEDKDVEYIYFNIKEFEIIAKVE